MADFKIKVDFVPYVNLDGTCNMKIGNTAFKVNIKEDTNIKEVIKNILTEIANESFIDTSDELNCKVINLALEEIYNKNEFINDILYAFDSKCTLMTQFRGIGKSTFLYNVAKAFSMPIITGYCKNNESYNGYENVYKVNEVRGMESCLLLVDEVSLNDIHELRNRGFEVIGFCRYEKFY